MSTIDRERIAHLKRVLAFYETKKAEAKDDHGRADISRAQVKAAQEINRLAAGPRPK